MTSSRIAIASLLLGALANSQPPPAQPSPQQSPAGAKLVAGNDCASCHAADREVVGPSYAAIAKRYSGQANAAAKLAVRIREGGSGVWGDVAMTPHADLKDVEARQMAAWILSVKSAAPASPKRASRLYTYKLKNGSAVQLDFPLYAEGKAPKVSKEIFKGYALYNSYCYRCHGTDATGGELAPDLRASLTKGMREQTFLSVAMAGKKEKGMPSWAGFFSPADMTNIYRYVKGRSLDLLPAGRPPSEQD